MSAREVHVIVPEGVDDQARPSGGNHYDRRVCDGLVALGWSVHEHAVCGAWPSPAPESVDALGGLLAALPAKSLVLVDGLVGSAAPEVLRGHTERLRLVMLVHLPLGVEQPMSRLAERGVLERCARVVTTSEWTRAWLVTHYGLDPGRLVVVTPGVDAARIAPGTATGGCLLVVGRVSRLKGHDVLATAFAEVADLPWHCTCVGAMGAHPVFVAVLQERLRRAGVADRVELTGALPRTEVARAYAAADLLVVPSRAETYGMVITEALARAIPVVASSVGGVADALGRAPDGRRPGLMVRPEDGRVLGRALRWWLTDSTLRDDLRDAARARRLTLSGWDAAAEALASALTGALRPTR